MEWRDEGVVIGLRPHGETSAIAEILTAEHGRCMGMVRGGRSRLLRPVLQTGNLVMATWRARLDEHLGTFQIEGLNLRAGFILAHPLRLAGMNTLTALAQLLPEREPHPRLYEAAHVVLSAMDDDAVWPALLVRWEMGLLDELGFGLDLSRCASTGQTDDLAYISPRTGRAVSREAGKPYHERLFQLPAFLCGGQGSSAEDVLEGFKLTGFFLERHIFAPRQVAMPPSRAWLFDGLRQRLAA
ncbi:DNA repair protein RecO [Aestuariivirga litoralis]|uniref:DNA repair protein RecO n=1 Tax=Aestuariivirga litoralis TaxID=2650924 RepID=UPI0018C6F241|nr:DNA repair protein RecO [Aestuariivirga litoralis]MBG1231305.1 DNA repair protein RecO [Aestuariivirga litoralis]